MDMKLLKLILKVLASPILLVTGIAYLLCSVIEAVSSVVTSLVGTVFLIGAACGWTVHAQPGMVWSVALSGIVILFLPLIMKGASRIVLKLTDPVLKILAL